MPDCVMKTQEVSQTKSVLFLLRGPSKICSFKKTRQKCGSSTCMAHSNAVYFLKMSAKSNSHLQFCGRISSEWPRTETWLCFSRTRIGWKRGSGQVSREAPPGISPILAKERTAMSSVFPKETFGRSGVVERKCREKGELKGFEPFGLGLTVL